MASDKGFSWRRCLAWTTTLAAHVAVLVAMTLPVAPTQGVIPVADAASPAWVPVELARTEADAPAPLIVSTPRGQPPPRANAPDAAPSPRPIPERRRRRVLPAQGSTTKPDANVEADVGRWLAEDAPPGSAAPAARTIVYLDDEARARLPHEDLYAATPPPREGDYYTPGDGSEDDVFYRPRALDPNPSRFAHAWRPRGNLIDDWLATFVEKATGTVTIPLNPKFSLVCGTVAGIAGGCGIVRIAGTGVIVQRPPPAPWDRSNRVQCRELRAALDDAEEAVQVAYFLDRLSALCSEAAPDAGAGNDEARREAGLPEADAAAGEAPADVQRAL